MITVFVKEGFRHVWNPYLEDWAGDVARSIELRTYEELRTMDSITSGAIIFSDIERLTSSDRFLAREVVNVIRASRPDIPILNEPSCALRRYALLRELYERSVNPFNVYRLTDTTQPPRFPVFLRYENDHTGATTGLLSDQSELDRAIVRAWIRGHELRDLLIVEFVDTRNSDGLFMKYGAVRVRDTIMARHAHTSANWVVKARGASETDADVEREVTFVHNNPHAEAIRAVFEIAKIDYGRVDYATLGDSIVVWEINTNPLVIARRVDQRPGSMRRQKLFIPKLNAAFAELSNHVTDPNPVDISEIAGRLDVGHPRSDGGFRRSVASYVRAHKRSFEPLVRVAEFLSIPFEQAILSNWKRRAATGR